MDAESTSLTQKDDVTAAESVCTMDIASPAQVQTMDMSQNVEGSLDDTTQLNSNNNCNPASEKTACKKPAVIGDPAVPCQSVPSSTDVEMQGSVAESSQRMETGSQENLDDCEGACSLAEKDLNEQNTAERRSLDENKSSLCITTTRGKNHHIMEGWSKYLCVCLS